MQLNIGYTQVAEYLDQLWKCGVVPFTTEEVITEIQKKLAEINDLLENLKS